MRKQFTQIDNVVLEALARFRIPGEARQVLDVIIRKTWGWRKKADAISLSQFVFHTGLSRPNVCRAINKLEALNIIIKKETSDITNYSINKDFSTWRPLSKKRQVSKKIKNVVKNDNNRYQERDIQKKVLKESIKRKDEYSFEEYLEEKRPAINEETKEGISYYMQRYLQQLGHDHPKLGYMQWSLVAENLHLHRDSRGKPTYIQGDSLRALIDLYLDAQYDGEFDYLITYFVNPGRKGISHRDNDGRIASAELTALPTPTGQHTNEEFENQNIGVLACSTER